MVTQESGKLFYLTRVQIAHATTDAFIVGMAGITATPFAAGADNMVDGMYFYKAAGATSQSVSTPQAIRKPSR